MGADHGQPAHKGSDGHQRREPVVHLNGGRVEVEVAQPATNGPRDDERQPGPTGAVLHTQHRVHERRIRQGSQRSTGNVETGDAAANHRQENKTIDDVGEPVLLATLQGDDKRAANRSGAVDEVCIVAGDAHADEPNVEDEKEEDAPKDGHDDGFDRFARLDGLAGDDGNVLRGTETESRLHKGLGETLHVGEGARVLPVLELDGPVGSSHTPRGHDEHVGDDDENRQDFEPRGDVLDVAVHAHGKDVGDGGDGEE